jgi:hypothetical protein
MTLRKVMEMLFVSHLSTVPDCQFGASDKNKKGKSTLTSSQRNTGTLRQSGKGVGVGGAQRSDFGWFKLETVQQVEEPKFFTNIHSTFDRIPSQRTVL